MGQGSQILTHNPLTHCLHTAWSTHGICYPIPRLLRSVCESAEFLRTLRWYLWNFRYNICLVCWYSPPIFDSDRKKKQKFCVPLPIFVPQAELKLHRVSETSHRWLAITLTHMNGFWYFWQKCYR